MNSFIMYQLGDIKDENAVSKIFSKYCPGGTDKFGNSFYLQVKSAPDFCKLVGFSSINDTAELEQIADFISNSKYEKGMDKFNQKTGKMHSKLVNAKKSVNTSDSRVGVGGLMSATSVSQLVNAAEQQQQVISQNTKVLKAQEKLDKFIDKNKMYQESAQYTTAGKSAGGLISWGSGTDTQGKNIYETIEAAKKPKAEQVETSLKQLKEFLGELLKVAGKVGMMPITDGNKTDNQSSKKSIKLDKLTSADLMNAQNREIIYITK